MQEILSQGEIDSLLEALNTGTLDIEEVKKTSEAAAVKPYDFRRPNKFSKEHLRTLEMLHQQFARLLSSFLSGYLRSSINVEVASVGQMIFEEFMRSIPSPTIMTLFEVKPLEGTALLETSTQLAFPIIDLLFGGPGTSIDQQRELTDIELIVIRKLLTRILEHLATSWQDFYAITPNIQTIETNPRMHQLYSANEVVALITLNVYINDESRGLLNLCLPYILLEPMISLLSVRQQFLRRSSASKPDDLRWLQHWLGFSDVSLQVRLGETELTVEEFMNIQEGDVLILDRRVDRDLDMYVEDELKFAVQAGKIGENLAVQVVALSEGEKENV